MQPYAHLNIPHESITKKLKQFVIDRRFNTDGLPNGNFLTKVSFDDTFQAVPELKTLFEMYELNDLAAIMIVKAPPISECLTYPHIDIMPPSFKDTNIAINWPILNYENTYTTFYEAKPNAVCKTTTLINGWPYSYFAFEDVVEQYRIKIDRPTAFRYDRIHSVINETDDYRFTASFRFWNNHPELFEKDYE